MSVWRKMMTRGRGARGGTRGEQRLREQNAALNELARQQAVDGSVDDLRARVARINEVSARTLEVARSSVWLYGPGDASIRCVDLFERSTGAHAAGTELMARDFPAYFRALGEDQTITAHDAHADPRTSEFTEAYLKPLGITSMLDAPIRVSGRTVGVVCHEHVGRPRRWALGEQNFADAVTHLVAVAIEACERRRAEQALRRSEERFRAAAGCASDLIYEWDVRTGRLDWFGDVDGQLGYPPGGFPRTLEAWERSVHPDDHARVMAGLQMAMDGRRPFRAEYRIRRADGTWVFWSEQGAALGDEAEDGRATRMVGSVSDVTARKRAEDRLARFTDCLLTFGPNPLSNLNALTALCGELLGAGWATYRRIEHDALYTVGRWNLPDGYPAADAAGGRLCHDVARRGGAAAVVVRDLPDTPYARTDPAVPRFGIRTYLGHPVRCHGAECGAIGVAWGRDAAPTPDDLRLIGIIAAAIGVEEERRLAIESLRASEERFRAFMNNSPAVAYMKDDRGRYVYCNATFERRFRTRLADWVGRCDADMWPADTARRLAENDQKVLASDRPVELTEQVPDPDGAVRDWMSFKFPVRDAAGRRFVAGMAVDVTERTRAEAVERERNALKASVVAMDQVLGVVGHELRTPLAALRAMSEYLLTDGARQTEEWERFLLAVNDEVVRMSDTVNNLLEAARLNSGQARWNFASFDVKRACEDGLESVRPLVDGVRLNVTCTVEPPGLRMTGDADAVRRLVLNLASNARRHTDAGEIRVWARESSDAAGRWVELNVTDTGQGIPPDVLERLGEAYALNVGVTGTTYIGGTGLGIAICKRIAAAHGGTVTVRSRVGVGTTVTVRLRADLAEPVPHEPAHPLLPRQVA